MDPRSPDAGSSLSSFSSFFLSPLSFGGRHGQFYRLATPFPGIGFFLTPFPVPLFFSWPCRPIIFPDPEKEIDSSPSKRSLQKCGPREEMTANPPSYRFLSFSSPVFPLTGFRPFSGWDVVLFFLSSYGVRNRVPLDYPFPPSRQPFLRFFSPPPLLFRVSSARRATFPFPLPPTSDV